MLRVVEAFTIEERGTVVLLDGSTDLPVSRKLSAKVLRPDGSVFQADAYKEWLLRRSKSPVEGEAFLLRGVAKEDVPVGSKLQLAIVEPS